MSKNDKFISSIVNETLDSFEVNSYRLAFVPIIQCYQLEANNETFTFPSNWSVFQGLAQIQDNGLIVESDRDSLNEIFSSFFKQDIKLGFSFLNGEVFLLTIPKKMEIKTEDLHQYLNESSYLRSA